MKTKLEARILGMITAVVLASCGGALSQPVPPGGTNGGGGFVFECTNPPPYTVPGLKIYEPQFQGTNLFFVVLEPTAGAAYDLFYSPVLSIAEVWTRLAQGATGQTNFLVPNPFSATAFFILGTMLDSDSDGLTDAYEWLVSKSDPYIATLVDTDGDGMPDGWEVRHGFNPAVANGSSDADSDNLSNYQEYLDGTDPNTADQLTIFVSTPIGTSNLP
jgi:hypothetical protein